MLYKNLIINNCFFFLLIKRFLSLLDSYDYINYKNINITKIAYINLINIIAINLKWQNKN